jgi:hypothetical protein
MVNRQGGTQFRSNRHQVADEIVLIAICALNQQSRSPEELRRSAEHNPSQSARRNPIAVERIAAPR